MNTSSKAAREAKPSDVLQSIADVLLGAPEVWTQGESARDDVGGITEPDADDACRWCAIGLLQVAANDLDVRYMTVRSYIDIAVFGHADDWISKWNDSHERAVTEVQSAFQQAADLAREDGQ